VQVCLSRIDPLLQIPWENDKYARILGVEKQVFLDNSPYAPQVFNDLAWEVLRLRLLNEKIAQCNTLR